MIRRNRIVLLALGCWLVGSIPASAAPSGGMPQLKGEWHPAVGNGAVYQMEERGRPSMTWEIAVVGHESVNTPAGIFVCDHYQTQGTGGPFDVWVTSSVSPYGLVKMTSPRTTVTLSKLVKGAKSRITETPQKLEIPQMPGLSEMMERGRRSQR